MKRYLPLIIIVGVLAVAVGAGVTLWRSSKQATPTTQTFTDPAPVPAASQTGSPNNRVTVAQPVDSSSDSLRARGPATAKVTLEEYGDYQCPPCGLLFHDLKTIEKEYGKEMRLIFRHFPLQGHKHALLAAHAAEAAGLQGHFWEMHDMIYQNQLSWSPADDARTVFIQYATNLGLDVDRFIRDIDSASVAAKVDSDYQRGLSVNVTGTPTVFLNGRQMNPNVVTLEGLRMALDYMLGKKK